MTHFDTAINRRNCETGYSSQHRQLLKFWFPSHTPMELIVAPPFSDYTQLWLLLSLLGPRCRLHRKLPLCKVISRHLHISTNYILHIHYGRNSKIAIQTLSKPLWRPVLYQSRAHSQSPPLNIQTTSQSYREHFIFLPTRKHTHRSGCTCVLYSRIHTKFEVNA